ncbi:MAG: cobalamin B12-binding domain-containing protein [Thermoanaerobacteraceae bacterium]|nr:cobalamin B12-binding domain-containing protein [Thermoanaerobacteraceae bacterium]
MMKKVMLITPPFHTGVVETACRCPHLGFVYLAGHLRQAGFDVEIYDAMMKDHDMTQIAAHIERGKPDVVASTAYTASVNSAMEVLKIAKDVSADIITVIGGIHANFCYQELLHNYAGILDFVIRGEGEETFPELLNCLQANGNVEKVKGVAFLKDGRVISTPARPFIKDLDRLIPAWDLLDWEDYSFEVFPGTRLALVNSSRGCLNACSFCSQQKFWQRTYRERSAESFVDELQMLKERFGVEAVMLSDEYPSKNRQRWETVLDMLIERDLGIYLMFETCVEDILRDADILEKYRKAGVIHIYVGVEATSNERLAQFKKNIKCEQSKQALDLLNQAGIITECSFVIGMPDETPETISETLQLAQHYNPDFAHFLLIAPWPYADLYSQLKEYIFEYDYSKYSFVDPVIKPRRMTVEQLVKELHNCYKVYYQGKMREVVHCTDDFKKQYMLQSIKLLEENSFLTKRGIDLSGVVGHGFRVG